MENLNQKLDEVLARLDRIEAAQAARAELFAELQPIARAMMDAGVARFGDLEARGYFTFAREIMRAADSVVTGYSADDIRLFADHAVTILDTVRNLTQPAVLGMVDEATDAVQQAGEAEPVGAWGMYKATKDEDVRKGMSVVFEVVRQIGKTAKTMEGGGERPRRSAPPGPAPARTPRARPATPRPAAERAAPAPAACAVSAGGATEFVEGWDLAQAHATAASLGITLTPEAVAVIEWARADYQANGASPNVRRITQNSAVDVRTLYQLFPGGPGKKVALIAGIPKPGGCI